MIKKTFVFLGFALLVLIAIVLFNTFRAKSWPIKQANAAQQPLPDSAILHMSRAIQMPTISFSDSSAIDTTVFRSFITFIERSYPLIRQHLSRTLINGFSFVFEWKGQNTSLAPVILMSHYDVVPVESSA